MSEWISVEDRLPEPDQVVICLESPLTYYGGRVDAGDEGWLWGRADDTPWFYDGIWRASIEIDDEYLPSHWMELPPPPL